MDIPELAHVIEAILFVAGEPVDVKELQRALEVTETETAQAIDRLESDYDYHRRGICLKRFGTHVQLSTRAEYAPYVERLLQPIQKQSLSQSALETLAVVAYRQPVARSEIEAVRGVAVDAILKNLLELQLVKVVSMTASAKTATDKMCFFIFVSFNLFNSKLICSIT